MTGVQKFSGLGAENFCRRAVRSPSVRRAARPAGRAASSLALHKMGSSLVVNVLNMSSFLKVFFALLILVVISVALFYYMKDDKSISQNENDVSVVPEVDLRSKIGQMILLGFRGTTVTKDLPISTMIKDLQIGGIILFDYDVPSQSFPRNITGPAQVKQLIADLQSYSATPLFVSVDAEGGNVNRLKEKYGFANILSAKDMGKDATLKTTERESVALAQELKELGFNMNFAPVVDVDINPGNPVIGALGRSFSLNPKTVTDHAKIFI